eukprot:12010123-Heterocapsa_arctica.AAC.1
MIIRRTPKGKVTQTGEGKGKEEEADAEDNNTRTIIIHNAAKQWRIIRRAPEGKAKHMDKGK